MTCQVLRHFRTEWGTTLQKYPFLAAEKNGEICGYAYTGPLNSRAAYTWAAETTVYLKENKQKQGIGRTLYTAIEKISQAQHITNLYACIGYPGAEDEYLTKNSAQFHAHLGYQIIGEFHQCGYKFGQWYNMVWMEKIIAIHALNPAPFVPFPDLHAGILRNAGIQS